MGVRALVALDPLELHRREVVGLGGARHALIDLLDLAEDALGLGLLGCDRARIRGRRSDGEQSRRYHAENGGYKGEAKLTGFAAPAAPAATAPVTVAPAPAPAPATTTVKKPSKRAACGKKAKKIKKAKARKKALKRCKKLKS